MRLRSASFHPKESYLKITAPLRILELCAHRSGFFCLISRISICAAKAMAAIVRRWDGHSFGGGPESPQYKELAEEAYYIADAMLRAREDS